MILYTRCYVFGRGYTSRRLILPDGALEALPAGALAEQKRKVFTCTGAQLFLGTLDGSRFGCVRNIETGLQDENGRACMANIAFEANKGEEKQVDGIIRWAYENYAAFARIVREMIVYDNNDYQLDRKVLNQLLETAPDVRKTGRAAIALLVPEFTAQYFLKNTGLPLKEKDIELVGSLD